MSIVPRSTYFQIHRVLQIALAFSLPFPLHWSSLVLVLMGVNWIIGGRLWPKIRATYRDPVVVMLVAFFGLHVLSALLSDNRTQAWAIVERRLPLVVVPLLLRQVRLLHHYLNIMRAFLAGLVIALLYCYGYAVYQYTGNHNTGMFFYHSLSSAVRMNAVYLSAFTVMGVFIALDMHFIRKAMPLRLLLILLALFIISILMLSSKLMFALLLAGLAVSYLYTAYRRSIPRWLLLVPVLVILLVWAVPNFKNRIAYEFTSDFGVLSQEQHQSDTHFTGTSLRLLLWKYSFQVVEEQKAWLTGVGLGDFQQALDSTYRKHGLYMGNNTRADHGYQGYNPHNAYVELVLAMGIPALILFLTILVMQFRSALRKRYLLYLLFLVLFAGFCLTESTLSTNKGLILYMFFFCVFRSGDPGREKTSKNP